jgi:hypothetical protein
LQITKKVARCPFVGYNDCTLSHHGSLLMTSVNKINQAIAAARGMPLGTVEAYSRGLRQAGVLPETRRGGGATPLDTSHAGYMLAAVMRGSPLNAGENGREVGNLVAHSTAGAIMEPLLQRQLTALGWTDGITFAEAIGWFLKQILDGTIFQYVREDSGVEVRIDRYWPSASFHWFPTNPVVEQVMEGWAASFADLETVPKLDRRPDGGLHNRMDMIFSSPFLHEAKIAYGVDATRNREAHQAFRKMKKAKSRFDVYGTESVTQQTLVALADAFRSSDAIRSDLPEGWRLPTPEGDD